MKLNQTDFPLIFMGALQLQSFTGDALHPFTKSPFHKNGLYYITYDLLLNPCSSVFDLELKEELFLTAEQVKSPG